VEQSNVLQAHALQVHIMLDTNISVPFNYSGSVVDRFSRGSGGGGLLGSSDSYAAIPIFRSVRVAPSPDLASKLVYMSLGYIQGEVSRSAGELSTRFAAC
jgi:hypothetical protein